MHQIITRYGRFFHQNQESDHRAVVITAFMAENLSWKDPIGKLLKIDSLPHEVIGIIENFRFYNFYYPTRPTMFTLADEDQFNYLSMRVKPGTESRSYETLKGIWTAKNPDLPFQGGFQEDVWTGFYDDLEAQKVFTKAIAIILVILAALGLYGLITYNITGRIREFSIRKVLGASVKDLANSISRQYLILFLLAIVASAPISHILIKATIDMMYPDPRPFGYSGVIIAEVILILVLSLVIISQVRKVSRSNPVEGLKVEA